jgi:predicted nucleic acid-binding protein
MHCVLDSSSALAWVLPGEASTSNVALLADIAQQGAATTGIWPLEVANVLLMAERRSRITLAERLHALSLLAELPIQVDPRAAALAKGITSELAASRGLTVYDASYLELALRLGLPLASLDGDLRRAALHSGVAVIG